MSCWLPRHPSLLAIVASCEDPHSEWNLRNLTQLDIFGWEHFAGLTPPQSVLSLSWCSAASPTSKQSRAVEYFRQVGPNMPGPYLGQAICILSPISSHIIMKYRDIEVSQYQNEMIQETTQNNQEIIRNIATFMVYACICKAIWINVSNFAKMHSSHMESCLALILTLRFPESHEASTWRPGRCKSNTSGLDSDTFMGNSRYHCYIAAIVILFGSILANTSSRT